MAATTKIWTLEEVHALPDDGNSYELVRGELFVTPTPSFQHSEVVAFLSAVLVPFVTAQRLGLVFHPHAVLQFEGSQVEPDLMVRADAPGVRDFAHAPVPMLAVEVLSPTTYLRDRNQKRQFYMDAGVAEYWMIDPDARTLTAVRAEQSDVVAKDAYEWKPAGGTASLMIRVAEIFVD